MTNGFKGLDLIEFLKNYGQRVMTLYRRQLIKTIPKKRKCKKAKWMSEEALQTAEKSREVKGKRGKVKYTHLNAGFQRITSRDKAFLNEQCKEMEEKKMGKTRDLLKKVRDTKGIFHGTMHTIKYRKGIHLTEAEEIEKRQEEYTEECTKKVLMTNTTMIV